MGVRATSETVSWAGHYKYTVQALKHTTLHAHIQTFHTHTHTPGMRIGPVHDTGLSAVLWRSIPATASIVAPQEQNRTEQTYFVLGGTQNLNSVSQSAASLLLLARLHTV